MIQQELFPDSTPIGAWFYDTDIPDLNALGRQYLITDYGIKSDGRIYTRELQALIDTAAKSGGVIVIPRGVFLTGALFFSGKAHLYLEEGAILKGSDDPSDYPVCQTRIEGESCTYFPALINVYNTDGFTLGGKGTIDGSGERSWKAFWLRRAWNPDCTNKDEQRARLLFFQGCTNLCIYGLTLQNAQFWTTHLYKCSRVKILSCRILSPFAPVPAPSTDAIDIDVCTDVLIKGCYMAVNDDAVALKGGKGMCADTAPENGANERIIIEDCEYGFCHGCLTCGSESVHNRNIIVRRVTVSEGYNFLWLKMRPDTPQLYELIRVEGIKGRIEHFININPWTQFCRDEEVCPSVARDITVRDCDCECRVFVFGDDEMTGFELENVRLENMRIRAAEHGAYLRGISEENVALEIN